MRYIYLIGAAKSGKSALAKKLAATLPNSRILDIPKLAEIKKSNYPLDSFSDYRVEVNIATSRAIESFSNHPKNEGIDKLIVVNSPLTNLAYAINITDSLIKRDVDEDDPELQQWLVTTEFLLRLVYDSVWNDLFFFLEGNNKTYFGEMISDSLRSILFEIGLEYTVLDGNNLQKYEKAATIIDDAKWLN